MHHQGLAHSRYIQQRIHYDSLCCPRCDHTSLSSCGILTKRQPFELVGTIRNCQLMTVKYDRDRIMFLRNQAQLLKDTQTYTQLGLAIKDSADQVNALEL